VREVLPLMRVTNPDTVLSFELAQRVAERNQIGFVLGLWVDRVPTGYRLTARLADVRSYRDVFETSHIASTRDGVIDGLDQVLRRTRRALGESAGDVANRSAPLPLVTTSSLGALRSFAEGTSAWRAGEYQRAKEFWERAIDLDTGFAMAYGALGNVEYYLHNRAAGELRYAAALSRAARLTERERLQLLLNQASFQGRPDSSRALGRAMAERFPSADAWYNYGSSLLGSQRHAEAVDAFKRALTIDPRFVFAWINLATTYQAQRRHKDALAAYRRAEAVDSTSLYRNNINHEFGTTLVLMNRFADAESVYRRMAAGPRIADRALGLRSLGLLALWQGRIYEAVGDFQQALEATQQMNSLISVARNRLWLAATYRAANRQSDAHSEVGRTIALATSPNFPPVMLALLAYACYQLDRSQDIDALVATIRSRSSDNPGDRASVAIGIALQQLVRQRPETALVALRQAANFNFPLVPMMLTAEAFQAAGVPDSARATLVRILDRDGFGAEGQDEHVRALLILGDVLLQLGDSAGAATRYQAFINRWRAAPPELPDLVTARARLGTLSSANRK
jgi:tetratricopeptide (TPR) repeat protein